MMDMEVAVASIYVVVVATYVADSYDCSRV